MISLIDYYFAANIFSLIPPIYKTFPFNVISPVIAMFLLIVMSHARLSKEVVIAHPADGPSFLLAPSGK